MNLATGEKHQLTESKERVFHPNQEQRFHDEKNIPQQIRQTIRIQDRTLKAAPSTVKLPIWTRPCFAHPEHGRRERRRKKHTAWLRNDRQLEAQPPKREQRERLAPALLRRKICSAAFGCRFHNAALTQTVLKGGSKSDRETDDSLTMSAVSSTSRSFQTSTDFAWRLLWRRNKKNKEEDAEKAHRAAVEKKAAKQAAERQAAKKSAEVASQVQQQAAKGTAAAASKATAAAVPVGAVVVLVLLILLLLGIIIFLVSCIFSLFGGVTASLNNPTLEAYVLSLDDSFEQEVRAEMESGDKVDGSFPKQTRMLWQYWPQAIGWPIR